MHLQPTQDHKASTVDFKDVVEMQRRVEVRVITCRVERKSQLLMEMGSSMKFNN